MKHSTMRNLAIGALVGLLATGVSAQQYRGDWWGHGHMGSGHMGSGGMHGWGWGQMNPGQQQRMQRHWTYMNQGVPGAYRGARSTVRATPQVIAEGRTLYSNNCASCHGAQGLGDGQAGRSLEPSPALLRQFVQMPMSGDEYLLWTISEGGERFGTDMPAFEDKLGEEDIWKIIAYMRAGFP
ncbi:c-type cytochrome [Sedimentitalea nanhaiensis]|uniref:Cytochrome c, mono-and diheme variants n=1 Tax=Sedimentitalea nanhaiensis TaxID=999627 RepID=A0A1I7DUR8_9RHOB|nr:cytochrome c [Sedimentitalea nanhaiensis]SFU15420.1 Cytochrome c, mono-and diheme variants [Sedimentitalea nanhaiensis]